MGLSRSSAAVIVFVAALVALAVTPLLRPKPTARQIRTQLLRELLPVALKNCTLTRVGAANDGGYLMCGNLLDEIQSAYSYGIGFEDTWGCEISRTHGVAVHQYDCFDPSMPSCPGGRPVFRHECIGPRTEFIQKRFFDTLSGQIRRNGDVGKTLVIKIDVEGAEVDSLMATPDAVLRRIGQLPMEMHGTDARFLALIRKLKRTFHVVHLHFNNMACGVRWSPLPAWAYQILLVNRRLGIVDPDNPPPVLPRALDAPDYALGPDCQALGPIEP